MNERNNNLEDRLNNLEQHHRGWGARILNVLLTPEEETDNNRVRDIVFNIALRPILEGAVAKNLLLKVPTADQLLETDHQRPDSFCAAQKRKGCQESPVSLDPAQ